MPAFINGKYAAIYGTDAEGSFYAYVTYENRVCPGFPLKHYATKANAAKAAEKMLAKATK